jgi:hypothetical protein
MNGEVWLYGSVARKDHDAQSDLDVLVVGDYDGNVRSLTSDLPQSEHLSVRRYGWDSIRTMAEYGSLFLLHLKREGIRLDDQGQSSLSGLLDRLPTYQRAGRDIVGFLTALDDVDDSLSDDGDPAFELAVIATVIRHSSILACYKLGAPTFGRSAAIRRAFESLGLGSRASEAIGLYSFRLAQSRAIDPRKLPTYDEAYNWVSMARIFVTRVGALDVG